MSGAQLLALFLLIVVSSLWGTSFVLIQIAAVEFSAVSIAFGRATVATLALGAFGLMMRSTVSTTPAVWWRILLLSLTGQVLPFLLLGMSGHLTTSSSAAVMMGVAPIATIVLAGILFNERWSFGRWLGVAIGAVGVLVAFGWTGLVGSSSQSSMSHDMLGKLCALGAAFGYALGAIIFRSVASYVPPIITAAASLAVSSIVLCIISLLQSGFAFSLNEFHVGSLSFGAIIVLGLANTGLAYATYYTLIKMSGPGFASLNNYLVPIIGASAGAIILGESLSWNLLIGLFLIIAGIATAAILQEKDYFFPKSPEASADSGS